MRGAYLELESILRGVLGSLEVERTQNPKFGDFTTNLPFRLARERRLSPFSIAQELAAKLTEVLRGKFKVEVAGGYLNFRLENDALVRYTSDLITEGWKDTFPRNGQKVLVEFISANPTGPLNVANARAGAVGDSIVRILKFLGYGAESEYYVNDAGRQIFNLGLSVLHLLYPERFPMPEDGYRGDYLKGLAKEFEGEAVPLLTKDNLNEIEIEEFGRKVAHRILKAQMKSLKRYGVEYDNFIMESEIRRSDYPRKLYSILRELDLIYLSDGDNEETPPLEFSQLYKGGKYAFKGKALLFRSSKFGDDKDRVMVRSSGEPTYFFWDAAYHLHKLERSYSYLLDIFGPDHHGYIPRIRAVVESLKGYLGTNTDYEVLIAGQVNLYEDGKRIRMSKRAGRIYTLDDLVEEVGKDAVRFFMLLRSPQTELNFDLSLARKAVKENPVFYTQYAHARICSLLDYAKANGVEVTSPKDLPGEERHIAVLLQYFPYYVLKTVPLRLREEVFQAMGMRTNDEKGGSFSPNLLVDYLIELSHAYHRFYQNNRIVGSERQSERLGLSLAVQRTLKMGLDLIGVKAPKRMG
ncbi:MAG: arginine--tRNA ligase [Thermotogae bacterium]|nr:arginine--tRNA ligase [Thermotogota bacterium]